MSVEADEPPADGRYYWRKRADGWTEIRRAYPTHLLLSMARAFERWSYTEFDWEEIAHGL